MCDGEGVTLWWCAGLAGGRDVALGEKSGMTDADGDAGAHSAAAQPIDLSCAGLLEPA